MNSHASFTQDAARGAQINMCDDAKKELLIFTGLARWQENLP